MVELDPRKVIYAFVGLAIGIAAAWVRTRVSGNEGYMAELIVTVFSVLAGFLSVVFNMVLMMKPPIFKSKTAQSTYASGIKNKLLRHSAIFYWYLVILFSVVIAELTRPFWPGTGRLMEVIYCGMSAAGLFWSFAVPGTLAQLHNDQMTLAHDNRKP